MITEDGRMATFNARNLNAPMGIRPITGLADDEKVLSIDYRPATGQLYGITNQSRLVVINETNGEATALGTAPLDPMIDGDKPSLDFNPTVDRIRLVTATGQNLRLHPELGTVVAVDGPISGGNNPRIGAVAYTNSFAGSNSTLLYDIDFESDKLFIQDPPNDGGLAEVGDLGVDLEGIGSFDISPDNIFSLATVRDGDRTRLFTINLSTGKATLVGNFDLPVIALSFKTNPIAYATDANNRLYRFNFMRPQMNSIALQGMMQGETVVGLDFRPQNGQLYAITSASRMLTINTANGATAVVGTLDPMLEGDSFGFDFNPTVDRIRLVSNTGQNLRLHPDLGTVVAVDGTLNPGMPFVNGAAYTNNFAGTTSTVLYVMDSERNQLFRQDPPNDGGLVLIGDLGVDIEAENGYDIGGKSNIGYALLKVDGAYAIYSVSNESGSVEKLVDFNILATSFAVGLGF
ncbi:hypothetical protein A3SI_00030 [Nitritalea halalkaliphila LW7]|uniref:DUF4394 domain-containing protein n=1 Tax=Nitritalea halalkaliphila LW7 TaxID=1189621 RepID=I5CAI0_9BACT|nr:DUF4394 domain-containing protein [Nitritalea halalkaliphila]EIM78832.1 hypothetical protein A3SI_00030 [Nitritalea halalkaliphila LW7]